MTGGGPKAGTNEKQHDGQEGKQRGGVLPPASGRFLLMETRLDLQPQGVFGVELLLPLVVTSLDTFGRRWR